MLFTDLDPVLRPWAAHHGLAVCTRHQDEEVRVMTLVDDAGDAFQLYVWPEPNGVGLVCVGAVLSQRALGRTFDRQRRAFDYRRSVRLDQLAGALEAAWQQVQGWIVQAGHTRTPV